MILRASMIACYAPLEDTKKPLNNTVLGTVQTRMNYKSVLRAANTFCFKLLRRVQENSGTKLTPSFAKMHHTFFIQCLLPLLVTQNKSSASYARR